MDGLSFTTETYPSFDRERVWVQALRRLGLVSLPTKRSALRFFGCIDDRRSPAGVDLALIAACPQDIILRREGRDRGCWIAKLWEGDAELQTEAGGLGLREGDIVYGDFQGRPTLQWVSHFQLLFISIPDSVLDARMLTAAALSPGVIDRQSGIGRMLDALLGAVRDGFATLSAADLRPLDLALSGFVMSGAVAGNGGQSRAPDTKSAMLQRICQTVEARLHEPELGVADIAVAHAVSTRSVQKMFEAANETFGAYLKRRRLERCRADLANPVYAQVGVSSICFRWGFNEAAHFSRAFKETFGLSPRDYRRQSAADLPQAAPHPVRGRPARSGLLQSAGSDALSLVVAGADEFSWRAEPATRPATHHHLPANRHTVHWGYFSRDLPPVLRVASGDTMTIETLTHHAYDDHARMIEGDAGAESVFHWTAQHKAVDRRGAGPMDASIHGRGAGEGFGVHICTGPIAMRDALPGDVIELRILDIEPRRSRSPPFEGRSFGSNAATWWGFHYDDLLTEPNRREVVTIYEMEDTGPCACASAVYNFRWTPQTDPSGVVHATIDYPGIPVDHATIEKNFDVLRDVRIPVRPHFGVVGLAPQTNGIVDSVPPASFGGNIDNWRLGKGACIYLPVAVAGGLLSIGDPHASQGDSEVCGTAIECSLTGHFQAVLHKKADLPGTVLADLDYPLIETPTEWVLQGFSHPNYLVELGHDAQSEVYKRSSIDLAMRDAMRKTRRFLMSTQGLTEDEAISLMSVAVDFGITQVVDGNWGVHATIRKALFSDRKPRGQRENSATPTSAC